MSIILMLWAFRFELKLKWVWTEWYLIVNPFWERSYERGFFTLIILWFIQLHIRIPLPPHKKAADELVASSRYL